MTDFRINSFCSTSAKRARCTQSRVMRYLYRILARAILIPRPDIDQRRKGIFRIGNARTKAVLQVKGRSTRVDLNCNTIKLRGRNMLLPFFKISSRILASGLLGILRNILISRLCRRNCEFTIQCANPCKRTMFYVLFRASTRRAFILSANPRITVTYPARACVVKILFRQTIILWNCITRRLPSRMIIKNGFGKAILWGFHVRASIYSVISIFGGSAMRNQLSFYSSFLNLCDCNIILYMTRETDRRYRADGRKFSFRSY